MKNCLPSTFPLLPSSVESPAHKGCHHPFVMPVDAGVHVFNGGERKGTFPDLHNGYCIKSSWNTTSYANLPKNYAKINRSESPFEYTQKVKGA